MAKKGASLSFTLPDGTQVTMANEDAQRLFQTLQGGAQTRPIQGRPMVPPRPMPQQMRHPITQPQRRLPVISAKDGIKNAPTDMLVLIHKGESVIPAKKGKK